MDNNKTVTMKMSAPIVTPDGEYELSFRVSVRSGVTAGMIEETVAHFLHAAERLAIGELGSGGDQWLERSEYELVTHEQNRVVIFGDMQVYTASGMRLLPVNIFSETTAAHYFILFAWVIMEGMGQVAELDRGVKFPNVIKPQKSQGELDKHFGKREEQLAKQAAPPPATAHQPPDPNDTPRLGSYDCKQKAEYTTKYGGQTVRFDVLKMSRIYDSRDGSPLVQVYSSYNGSLSQYPSHDLKIKPNRLEKVDDYTRMILQAILDGEENNTAHEGSYYMFVNDEGKMYPVLAKLSLKGQAYPPDPYFAYDQNREQPDRTPTEYDDIPF